MLFLIEYDRPSGELVTFRTFADSESAIVDEARLNLELVLHECGIEHEVVVMQAESEEALRQTHGRYFYDPVTLAKRAMDDLHRRAESYAG